MRSHYLLIDSMCRTAMGMPPVTMDSRLRSAYNFAIFASSMPCSVGFTLRREYMMYLRSSA
jgi:hypothetical protein